MIEIPAGPREEHRLMLEQSEMAIIVVDVNEMPRLCGTLQLSATKSCLSFSKTISPPSFHVVVTVFLAVVDESFSEDANWKRLEYQFVTTKVDKEGFDSGSVGTGSELLTYDLECMNVIVNGYGSINNVTITDWNIYNDELIIVNGVQNFFNCDFWCSSKS
ncbi:hypothetical protein DITRI_Ditri10aG0172900 [Diplodiscus trichospermus]